MTYRTEFPDFDAATMPQLPADFADISWHNDACPSFASESRGITVFIDYADAADREFPETPRFCVRPTDDDDAEASASLETDNWADVLAFIDNGARQ